MTAADEGTVDEPTLARIVSAVDADWTLGEATRIEAGGNELYRVAVETTGGLRRAVLKLSGDGAGGNLSAEPRVLRLLGAETRVPVPPVLGVVDDHPDLPAPFFLMADLDGEQLPVDPGETPLDDLAAFARDVGRHLGEVHALGAFDGFGPIVAARDVDPDERGGTRPLAREYGLTIPDPEDSWDAKLAATVEWLLDRHSDGRFGDLTPAIRDAIETRRAGLDLSGPPVIARIDHNLGNLLVDGETRTVTGSLDWGLVRTTHPEYELACAEQGFCATASLDGDHRSRLRAALYDGYRETNDLVVDEAFAARRRLHLLVFQTASMNWAEDWITPEIADEVERDNRQFVGELL